MQILETREISKSYRGRRVVDDVSVSLQQGEVVGLLGPNGAGKTTSFYMIVGLISPDSGRVLLDGEDLTAMPMFQRARHGISYLPQEASVFRKLTVEDNLMAILETRNMRARERRERMDRLIEQMGLQTVRRSKAYVLSGGERRRVEIARSLAIEPNFLLLDEPFSGIDPIQVLELQRIIWDLKQAGIGILVTDHNVRETLMVTDRAYIINNGKIFRSGSPDALGRDPEVKRVYLGESFTLATGGNMEESKTFQRREILGVIAGAGVAAALAQNLNASDERRGDMIYRTLGRTGEKVSAIGLGGSHIGNPKEEKDGIKIVRTAVDRGITFLDNCWDYHDGKSEVWMGAALRDGYRNKVFLMTKFDGRTKAAAAKQIDESLSRLQTDHLDLIQFHENIRMEDPDRFFAPGGPLEALMEAKKAGKIRYIGFTGHKDPAVHLRMLEVAAQHNFHFDTAQMPINILDASFRSFRRQVVPKLMEQGIALLGMKPMASGAIPKNGLATGIECLHFALSQPTSVVINGCDSLERLDQAFEAVRTFKPLTETLISGLVTKTRDAALSGKFELFKTDTRFDGTARNPQWMG